MSKSSKRQGSRHQQSKLTVPRSADDFFTRPEEFQTDWGATLRVISKMRSEGLSLRKAAKQEGAHPRSVSRLAGRALKRRSNGSYAVTKSDSLLRVMKVITPQGPVEIGIRNSQEASVLGRYWDAVEKARGDESRLAPFNGKFVKDVDGNKYPLITNKTELRRLASAGVLSFESIYARVA